MDKKLLEKFVQLRNQADELIKAMKDADAGADGKPDHSAEDCKDAECKFHGKSKSVSGSGGPDEGSHGAPSVGGPRESESSNASWPGKAAVASIENAQKKYDDRLSKIEECVQETAALTLKIAEQLKPTSVTKTFTVAKAEDKAETDAQKAAVAQIEKLKESDPTAAATLAIKLAQENPRFMVGGSRLLPAPAQRQ